MRFARRRISRPLVLLAVTGPGILAACEGSPSGSASPPAPGGPVRVMLGRTPDTLIPTETSGTEGSQILNALFSGLVGYRADGRPIERVAESISTADGRVWKIRIADGWTFHDGTPVTARSFVDAWNHGANPENGQASGYQFARIEGYDEVNPGPGQKPAATALRGLQVDGDREFTVRLSAPFSQFKTALGRPAFYPLPKAAFDGEGKIKKSFAERPIGNGPFALDGPVRTGSDRPIAMTRFERFAGGSIRIDRVRFMPYPDAEAALRALRDGRLDIIPELRGSAGTAARRVNPAGSVDRPGLTMDYLGIPLNTETRERRYGKQNAPNIRKAISMAIDRRRIARKAIELPRSPADDFVSPAVPGYRRGACGEACRYRPDEARALYEESGGPGSLEVATNIDTPDNDAIFRAVADDLARTLGVDVRFRPYKRFETLFGDLGERRYNGMFRASWVPDYPAMDGYLAPLFGTRAIGRWNSSRYASPAFDALLTKGGRATAPEKGLRSYQEADDLLVRDLPYLPLLSHRVRGVCARGLTGLAFDPQGHIDWPSLRRARN